jgi:hypothetical protein
LPIGPVVDFEVAVVVEIGDATVLGVADRENVLGRGIRAFWTILTREVGLEEAGMLQLVAEVPTHPLNHGRSQAQF